jgi:hypothetical protein
MRAEAFIFGSIAVLSVFVQIAAIANEAAEQGL